MSDMKAHFYPQVYCGECHSPMIVQQNHIPGSNTIVCSFHGCGQYKKRYKQPSLSFFLKESQDGQ